MTDGKSGQTPTPAELIDWVRDARQRTFDLVADLSEDQLIVPHLATVNPWLWEIGHVAWFQEKWLLRRSATTPLIRPDADALYDSAAVHHDTRWRLPLPGREETVRYMTHVRDRVVECLLRPHLSPEDIYFTLLTVFHEDMHTEAFTYTRQTLGYAAPRLGVASSSNNDAGKEEMRDRSLSASQPVARSSLGDAAIPEGIFELGAAADEPFVFDNEKWAHRVEIRPFAIGRAPLTQAEFVAFVEDGGYRDARWWSEAGWRWRAEATAAHPVYWRREGAGKWWRRHFDQWRPLEPDYPVVHVNWHEAEAYCRWAGRRLPTESEWEAAAAVMPNAGGPGLDRGKRRFPWGAERPSGRHANLDWHAMGCVNVDGFPDGDSACGCRQMIGNVWEWTASDFLPYPGFVADPYKEYSAPWFGTHKVLRGGCWATRARLLRNTWRNFYRPERRDVWAGFRTCALRA